MVAGDGVNTRSMQINIIMLDQSPVVSDDVLHHMIVWTVLTANWCTIGQRPKLATEHGQSRPVLNRIFHTQFCFGRNTLLTLRVCSKLQFAHFLGQNFDATRPLEAQTRLDLIVGKKLTSPSIWLRSSSKWKTRNHLFFSDSQEPKIFFKEKKDRRRWRLGSCREQCLRLGWPVRGSDELADDDLGSKLGPKPPTENSDAYFSWLLMVSHGVRGLGTYKTPILSNELREIYEHKFDCEIWWNNVHIL